MARVKYHPAITPLVNEHFGFTFQAHSSGQSITTSKKNDRFRNVNQSGRQQNLMRAIRNWRNMSSAIKDSWNLFASTFPQTSRRNPARFLTGYQLFLKRSHYCFLNQGITSDFMEAPVLAELDTPEIEFVIAAEKNTLDVTELYLKNFGILPESGQFLLIRIFPMAVASGQFFSPLEATVEVEQIYLDGLFVSFNFPVAPGSVVFSVYLSKVFHQSKKYIGTKVRYMGCFTPKTFLELTDTPDSYVGQSEKIVSVKADESGLEFIANGGGGIDCDDLLDCSIIQQMILQIEANSTIISELHNTAIPPVNFGLLYNWFAFNNILKISSSSEWIVMDYVQLRDFFDYLGSSSAVGGYVKITGFDFWNSPNTGAVNSAKLNVKGAGYRDRFGTFNALKGTMRFWTTYEYLITKAYAIGFAYNLASRQIGADYKNRGWSLIFRKSAPGVSDGSTGIYVGNNGRVYRTICYNSFWYTADLIAETKYRDGSLIPEITDSTAWGADSVGALCAFNNDWSNV